jgi:saccharopine dehydrogenase (NAD+, L-lysine-forming)
MRILLVGAGGVGDAFAKIVTRRSFFDALVVTDYNLERAERTVAAVHERFGSERRLIADRVNASSPDSISDAVRRHRATHVLNAVDRAL